ncbi:winged helix-turn-helix transcriptional regulator [Marinicella gelatinilytica]|uniref:winged helix-turn-helix transcriptional regulator n=1 Tax=Marinicella gelatinilytica TaxID=2996017 RepID=UPI002260ECAA|nr:winged helix-turn-helix transcriptional regulator [Marinicella gelatinilytica]MCX7545335.1 winged helix-turn-helix domain-containing protein [Marinicella gelatinilytica]
MLYFSGFQLDLKRKELSYGKQIVDLTKKTYDLLVFLIQNPQQVHTKDDLISHVWQGRVVSGNTIDQTISKLRKLLSEYSQDTFIESVYGQGIQWNVAVTKHAPKRSKINVKAALAVVVIVSLLSSLWWWRSQQTPPQEQQTPHVLLQLSVDSVDWEIKSAGQFLKQLLSFSSQSSIKSTDDRPLFVLSEDFVRNQQKLIPDLTIIRIKPVSHQQQMAWLIEVSQAQQLLVQTTVAADNFQSLIVKSTELLVDQLGLSDALVSGLLPKNDYVMVLYVRGLQSLDRNEFNTAKQQFQLAIEEQPSFHLARLKLAESLNKLGQIDEAVSSLDTLLQLPVPAAIQVAATTLKMRIVKVKGDYPKAAEIYQQLLADQVNAPPDIWQAARYEYAAILQYLNRPQEALAIYDAFIDDGVSSEDVALLADVRASKASLLQQQGDVSGALAESEQALHLYELNQDSVGVARTYSVLARIANQKAQYKLAEQYLRQALTVTKSVGHKLGEGAVLNELIYALMQQGQHQEAWQLNNRLLAIGTELDYSGMLMAAYQAFYEMSRIQKNWDTAARWQQSYQQLAENIQDQRRLVKAELFHLNLLLDQKITDGVADKIAVVQAHINDVEEALMQPALNVFRGRYQWLIGQPGSAIETLIEAKNLAVELSDYESLISANNYLAMYYLSQEKPQQALNTLAQSEAYKPFAIPYLRLKAEAQLMLNKYIDALSTITTCQQQAAQLWSDDEQAVLQAIKQAMN